MADNSKFQNCSPVITIPTREDILHPLSPITPEEMFKYRTMQGVYPKPSMGSTGQGETSQYSELDSNNNLDFKCAEASLAHYNELHSTNYKLIEVTKRNSFFHGWIWHHCLFKAALETSSVPETFFSELHGLGSNKFHVVTIALVENITETFDCEFCFGKDILHPVWTLSRDPDALYAEGRTSLAKVPPEFQKSYDALQETLKKNPYVKPFSQTYAMKHEPLVQSGQFSKAGINSTINAKHEGHGKMHTNVVSSHPEVRMIDGVDTQVCKDAQRTIATDAAPSHSPILPVVDVTPTAIKDNCDDVSGIGCGADNVQSKENIQARISVKRKASDGVSPPR